MNTPRRRVRLLVGGRVQGVGFRYATARQARRLGLDGWVRNTPDGRVEIVAAGSGAEIEELRSWCEHGPPAARVDAVQCADDGGTETLSGFSIRS